MSGLHGAVLGLLRNAVWASGGHGGCDGVVRRDHVGDCFSTNPQRRATAAGAFCSPIMGLRLDVVGVAGRCVVAEQRGVPSTATVAPL